jgi:hypothetical protein
MFATARHGMQSEFVRVKMTGATSRNGNDLSAERRLNRERGDTAKPEANQISVNRQHTVILGPKPSLQRQ